MGAVSRKFHRDVMDQARAICAAAGASCWFETGTGKHGKFIISKDGKRRSTPVSTSPRSDDALAMKLADIRRILREMKL
jgi:hypothetical protein